VKNGNTALEAATQLTTHHDDYGDPQATFVHASRLLEAMTGVAIKPIDLMFAMVAIKLTRELHCHKGDNLVDACAYLDIINANRENTPTDISIDDLDPEDF